MFSFLFGYNSFERRIEILEKENKEFREKYEKCLETIKRMEKIKSSKKTTKSHSAPVLHKIQGFREQLLQQKTKLKKTKVAKEIKSKSFLEISLDNIRKDIEGED